MAVIDLRGEGSIPDSIRRLGGAAAGVITSIKHPHKEENEEFRDLIGRNPQLVGAFSQLNRRNPGVVAEIFPFLDEDMITAITSSPPSADELAGDIEIGSLTPVSEGGTLTPEAADILGKFGVTDRFGTTPTGAVLEPKRVEAARVLPQEAVTAGLERDVRGLTPGQKSQDDFNTEVFGAANAAFDEVEPDEKKRDALRAKLPAHFFDVDTQELFRQRRILTQMQIDAQNLDRANERTDAFQRSAAARWVTITNAGTPEAWQLFLFDNGARTRANELLGGASVENETDIRLLEVARAFSRAGQVEKITQSAAASRQVTDLIERIERRDRDGKPVLERSVRVVLTEQLNAALSESSALSEGRTPIRIAEIPDDRIFGKNKALIIKDENGEEIDPSPARLRDIEILEDLSREEEARRDIEGGGPGPLNLETVDISKLPVATRDNLLAIIRGEGTFEQLQQFDPASAQLILDARRNR